MSRFEKAAVDFVTKLVPPNSSRYSYSIDEDLSAGSDDPSKRSFRVTFAKPSKSVPVAPACAHITVKVNFENNKYCIKVKKEPGSREAMSREVAFLIAS